MVSGDRLLDRRGKGAAPVGWGTRIRVRLESFLIRVERVVGLGTAAIRPPIQSNLRAVDVGKRSTGPLGPDDPVLESYPEGTDEPQRGSGDQRVPPPRDLEFVSGQQRPG